MRKFLLIFLLFLLIFPSACITEQVSHEDQDVYKQWVFITVETLTVRDSTDFYYYGQLSNRSLENLKKKEITGFFILKNMRFINDSDKLELYEDKEYTGSRLFRLKDVVKMDFLKEDPVLTYKVENLAPGALKVRQRLK